MNDQHSPETDAEPESFDQDGEPDADIQHSPDTPVRGHTVDNEELRMFKVVEGEDLQTHHVVARYPSEALEQVEYDLSPDYRAGLDHTPLHVRMLKPETEVEIGYEDPRWAPDGFEISVPADEMGFAAYASGTADQWVEHFGHVGVLSTTAGF